MSFFDEDFPKEDLYSEDDEIECNECTCDECHATFLLPADTEPETCPICGAIFDC